MATYYLTYTAWFNNRTSNRVDINIYRKDIEPDDVSEFAPEEITALTVGYPNGEESKYDCLIGCECNIDLRVRDDSDINPETFITDYYDEWKVIVTCDTLTVFAGFIEPSEGSYRMKDRPIAIQIKCTDGLGLTKNVALTQADGSTLIGETLTLIEYVAGALKKTNLDLPIRVFCSIYESSMNDRGIDITADMFNQTKLEYRTFLSSPTAFENCYKALEIILTGEFCLYQWNGYWVISSRTDMLNSIGPVRYFTDYDSDGAIIAGGHDIKSFIEVGKDEQQHPVSLDQLISYQVPAKSVLTKFNYEVWPEIPTNNKFERATVFETGTAYDDDDIDNDGDTSEVIGTYEKSIVESWSYGTLAGGSNYTLPIIPSSLPDRGYRKSVYNIFGTEISREIILHQESSGIRYFEALSIPVRAQDKIRISFDARKQNVPGSAGTIEYALVHLYGPGQTNKTYSLKPDGKWSTGGFSLQYFYDAAADAVDYVNVSVVSSPMPINGNLYIRFDNIDINNDTMIRNFEFEYYPFVAGGYVQVKSDQWTTSQNANIKDVISDTVFISDSTRPVIKGTLLRTDGVTPTTPTWYRYPFAESKHYKEIINLTKYNHYYRRFRKITGSFKGIKSHSENFMGDFFPIGFHKHYVFINNDTTRYYVIVPPISINYVTGQWSGQAIECFKDGDFEQVGDTHEFNFIFG